MAHDPTDPPSPAALRARMAHIAPATWNAPVFQAALHDDRGHLQPPVELLNRGNLFTNQPELHHRNAGEPRTYKSFHPAQLQHSDMRGQSLPAHSGYADLGMSDSNFTGARLPQLYLKKANLRDSLFVGAQAPDLLGDYLYLEGSDFALSNWENSRFYRALFDRASFASAHFQHAQFTRCSLREVNLHGANFTRARFNYVDFTHCTHWREADFTQAQFNQCTLPADMQAELAARGQVHTAPDTQLSETDEHTPPPPIPSRDQVRDAIERGDVTAAPWAFRTRQRSTDPKERG